MLEPPDGAPPRRHAFSEITIVSSGLRLPSLIALNASSAVITFTIEAGDIRSSAFFSNRTLPESASTRIAKGALVVIVCARRGRGSASDERHRESGGDMTGRALDEACVSLIRRAHSTQRMRRIVHGKSRC